MVAPIIPAANTVKPGTKFKPSARAAASKDRLDDVTAKSNNCYCRAINSV
jgi:hypothetical protein